VADHVHVLGVGPSGPAPMPADLPAPTAVVASSRFAELAADRWPDADQLRFRPLEETLDDIAHTTGHVLVLASGDPGWLGIGRVLLERFGRDRVTWHPATSSVAGASARARLPWDDARVVSAHGRDPHAAVAVACAHPKVAVLTAPTYGPASLARDLLAAGCGAREVVVAECLGHVDERVRSMDLQTAASLTDVRDPNVVLLTDRTRVTSSGPVTLAPPSDVPDRWALPTDRFVHRDGQISKSEVRALALAHLAPRPGRVVWDVGAGSGAVAVECARFGAAVHAVERDPEQAARVAANADAHGVAVRVMTGSAPDALASLPPPDAVFVGGGGSALPAILEAVVAAARPAARVVTALATVERATPVVEQLRTAGWHAAASLVQVTDLVPLAQGHRLAPRNPVLLVLAELLP
jgi:precorrin-6Y C5,15-methyltransferase (decarboxylating)